MKAPLSYVPALPATIGIVAGILACRYSVYVPIGIIAVVMFVTCYLLRHRYIAFCALMTLLGILIARAATPQPLPPEALGSQHTISAKVLNSYTSEASVAYTLRVDSIGHTAVSPVKCLLTRYSLVDTIPVGTSISITSQIQPLADAPALPHETVYADFLRAQGIGYTIADDSARIRVMAPAGPVRQGINTCQRAVIEAIVDSPVDSATSAFLLSVIVGDKDYLDEGALASFRSLGLAHMLALSGMHVGILASILSFVFMPVRLLRHGRIIRSALVIVLVWLYALVCGMGPSIMRAAVMITVFTLAWFVQRGYYVFNSLLVSVVVILCAEPLSLFSAGFQLSAVAVASIITFARLLPDNLRRHRFIYFMANLALVPFTAMLGTGLLSAFYFHTFPMMFMVSNIVGGLLFPLIFTGGVVLLLCHLCGFDIVLLGHIVDGLYNLLMAVTGWIADHGACELHGIVIPAWSLVPYYLALAMLGYLVWSRRRTMLWSALAMMTASVIVLQYAAVDSPRLEFFILKRHGVTHILACEQHRAAIAGLCERDCCSEEATRFLHSVNDYLVARDCIDSVSLSGHLQLPHIRQQHQYIMVADKMIYVAADTTLYRYPDTHIDYLLLTRDFAGNVDSLATALKPDTILIAGDTHPKRRDKWLSILSPTYPTRPLANSIFTITVP